MLAFLARRCLVAVPMVLAASFLSFVLVANAGDPLEALRLNPRTPPAAIAQREADLHLDRSVPERYRLWLGDVLQGDLGRDVNGNPVAPQLWRAMGVTLRLVAVAVVFAVGLAILAAVISATRQYSAFDHSATFVAFLCYALPTFWVAGLLKEFGAVRFNDVLEDLGMGRWVGTLYEQTRGFEGSTAARLGDLAGHLVLPAATLVLISFAQYSRYARASMLEVLATDYVRTARAKGIGRWRVTVHHGLRNALLPLSTVVAIDIGALMSGAIVVEQVFQWRGMGTLLLTAVERVDVTVMQAWLLASALIVIGANLVADVVAAWLDPRVRRG